MRGIVGILLECELQLVRKAFDRGPARITHRLVFAEYEKRHQVAQFLLTRFKRGTLSNRLAMERIRAALVKADEAGGAELPFLHDPLHVQAPEPLASYQG